MNVLNCYRIVTFVPQKHLERVVDAICASGYLTYGNYDEVLWFSAPGTGQFKPIENANPTQGEVGTRERCEEVRLEFSIIKDDNKLNELVQDILIPAHPWEEPAVYIMETRETRSSMEAA